MLCSFTGNLRGRRRKLIHRRLILVSFSTFFYFPTLNFFICLFPFLNFVCFCNADIGVKSPKLVVPKVAVGSASDVSVAES